MLRITRHLKNDRVHIRQERQIFQLKALDRQVTANFMQRPQFGKNPLDESVHLLGCRYARVGGVAFLFWRRTREQPFPLTRNAKLRVLRSEEHTSELQSLMRISYAVFCWKKKIT